MNVLTLGDLCADCPELVSPYLHAVLGDNHYQEFVADVCDEYEAPYGTLPEHVAEDKKCEDNYWKNVVPIRSASEEADNLCCVDNEFDHDIEEPCLLCPTVEDADIGNMIAAAQAAM